MIRNYNTSSIQNLLPVAIGILMLMFCISGLSMEAGAMQETSHQGPHWGYEQENGPANWGKMNRDWALCAEGKAQSPIDISDARQSKSNKMNLAFPAAKDRSPP